MSKHHRNRRGDDSQLHLFVGSNHEINSSISRLKDIPPLSDTSQTREEIVEPRKSFSGAMGGPSTARGVRYQLDYAIVQALKGISRTLSSLKDLTIGLEPRTAYAHGIDGWDILIAPPGLLIEVKLRPNSDDILGWLERVKRNTSMAGGREYRLVYGSVGTPLLTSLLQMTRLALEVGTDGIKFKELLLREGGRDFQRVLSTIGDRYLEILAKLSLHNVPPTSLEDTIEVLARQIAGQTGGRRLIHFLHTKFSDAMGLRLSLSVNQLVNEANSQGITLQPPPEIDVEDLSREAAAALFVLDCCPAPIPLEVLARGVRAEPAQLTVELEFLQREQVLTLKDELCFLTPRPVKPKHPEGATFAAATLDFLIDYVRGRPISVDLEPQLRNIKELAQSCLKAQPKTVAGIFSRLDKILKDLGDKHAVLEIANLSVEACRIASPRTDAEVNNEARALICGRSWVYQRVGRLHEAVAAAERSLQLAKDAGLDATLAFAIKCSGRLCRMEAERLPQGSKAREEKIAQSIAHLKEAIDKFGSLLAFGKEHPEVGDCYSLLGRTLLVAGLPVEANRMVRIAYRKVREGTKDHLDLLLLSAELDGKDHRESAGHLFEEAVRLCSTRFPDNSEMRARALLGRGQYRLNWGDKRGAIEDLKAAAEIWSSLGEQEMAARAKWEEIMYSEMLPRRSLELLEKQNLSPLVKVRVAEIYAREKVPSALSNRAEPSENYWREVIVNAKKALALELNEW